jgi:putative glutamine transport system substrate-binding protein
MEAVQAKGTISAGVSFDVPGMGYTNPQTGKIEGFEVDLVRAIARNLLSAPDDADFIQVVGARRIEALQDNQVDMVVSQMTITPERAEEVDFSVLYMVTREGILVPKESSIKSFYDLKGKRIAVTEGSVSLRRTSASLPSLPGTTLVLTSLSYGGLEAVAKGEADAASNDLINLTMLQKAAAHRKRYDIIDIGARFDPKPFSVAVKKGRRTLVDRLNQVIEGLKASREIDKLLRENIARLGGAVQ